MKKKSFILHLDEGVGEGELLVTQQGFAYAVSRDGVATVAFTDGNEFEVKESLQEISELLEDLED